MTTMARINEPRCGRNHLQCPALSEGRPMADCQDCIMFAADYERDLMHDTGEDEFETWIARNQDEEDEYLRR